MQLLDIIVKDSTDVSTTITIVDSTDGFTPETGVEYTTTGLDLWYRRQGAAKVSLSEVGIASLVTAHSDGGIIHVGDGVYRLDLPDAAVATGADHVDIGGTVTGMIVHGGRIRLTDNAIGAGGGLDAAGVRSAVGMSSANLDTQLSAIVTDTAEIGTAGAGLTDLGGMSTAMKAEVNAECDTALTDYDGPTNAEMEARTLAAAAYFDASTDTVDLGAVLGTALSETSGGYLAAAFEYFLDVATPAKTINDVGGGSGLDAAGIRSAIGLASANLDTQIADLPTVAEFEARTLAAAAYFDASTDTVDLGAVKGTALSETGSGYLAAAFEYFFDIATPAKTANDIGGLDAAGIRTAVGLASANLDTQLADLPTVAEFEARTLVAASYFDPATDTVADVTVGGFAPLVQQQISDNLTTLAFTRKRAVDWAFTIAVEDLSAISWDNILFTIKAAPLDDDDADALIQVKLTNGGDAGDGLQILNGSAAGTAGDGAIVKTSDTQLDITILADATAVITPTDDDYWTWSNDDPVTHKMLSWRRAEESTVPVPPVYQFDVKVLNGSGSAEATPPTGTLIVQEIVTKTVD